MKAISIRQPWAWCVVHRYKPLENRTWSTRYRGPVLIHAGRLFSEEVEDAVRFIESQGVPLPPLDTLERGGIVGRARLVDMVKDSRSKWFFGPWGWVFEEAEPRPFHPATGRLGLFDVELAS